ncbi:ABC transporter ATP-binding protein [Kibdelosporangium persicum]|uniref:ABC transporter ATP-binding protein n=1 Tax=Kibdelosporangium persicum TaxID=2698649 RepID=UPI0028B06F24|nr:ATP-binding cassette domain-containing protein [Kibdelosporangium persicum]
MITDVDLTVESGATVGLAGPSGSGKSTLARVLSLLHKPFAGSVSIDGTVVGGFRYRAPRQYRTKIGVLFQQPRLSVDPRMTLRQVIAEPSRANGKPDRVDELSGLVALTPDLLARRAHEVSDGQLQRACLARALALRPAYLVCDEMTTMLDASTTAALVAVIRDYQSETGAGVLAISHDTVLLERWADRVEQMRTERMPTG